MRWSSRRQLNSRWGRWWARRGVAAIRRVWGSCPRSRRPSSSVVSIGRCRAGSRLRQHPAFIVTLGGYSRGRLHPRLTGATSRAPAVFEPRHRLISPPVGIVLGRSPSVLVWFTASRGAPAPHGCRAGLAGTIARIATHRALAVFVSLLTRGAGPPGHRAARGRAARSFLRRTRRSVTTSSHRREP